MLAMALLSMDKVRVNKVGPEDQRRELECCPVMEEIVGDQHG
jgi:hypothetical protein